MKAEIRKSKLIKRNVSGLHHPISEIRILDLVEKLLIYKRKVEKLKCVNQNEQANDNK